MMLTTLIGATLFAIGPTPTTAVRPAADIIEIRAEMFDDNANPRRDQIRYSTDTHGEVVAEMGQDGSVNWKAQSDRERLGGQDAPALIYVRVFDAVFAIDPFVAIPEADLAITRSLFRGSSLETDQSAIARRRVDRTKELFEHLEHARHNWLRENGYYLPRTVTRISQAVTEASSNREIEPVMKIERPADVPRGRSYEEVQGTPAIDSQAVVSRPLLDSDQPIRISVPHGTAADVVAQVETKTADESESTDEIAAK